MITQLLFFSCMYLNCLLLRWSTIAKHLPKRTDNEIKNYWNTHVKKRLSKLGIDPVTHKPKNDFFIMSDDGDQTSKNAAKFTHMAQWERALNSPELITSAGKSGGGASMAVLGGEMEPTPSTYSYSDDAPPMSAGENSTKFVERFSGNESLSDGGGKPDVGRYGGSGGSGGTDYYEDNELLE